VGIDKELGTLAVELEKLNPKSVGFADKVKAAVAYCLNLSDRYSNDEPSNFAWSCGGFAALCKIKAEAVMARSTENRPPRTIIEQVLSFEQNNVNFQMYISLKANSAFTRAENSEI